MRRFVSLLTLLIIMVACNPGDPPLAEQAAIDIEPTAVLPTPTLNAPRLEAAATLPVQPTTPPVQIRPGRPTDLPATEVIPTETKAAPEPTPTVPPLEADTPPAEVSGVIYGRTAEGAFFQGDSNAPITLIDYSDFLWGNCRTYVLGTEPDIVANYVEKGKVQIVFWPVLNHGNPSVYSTLTAVCVGQQDPALFWDMHEHLFQNQGELYGADRDYYINVAVAIGADQAAFEACYDGPGGLAEVMELDTLRRERGIYSQPTFEINDNIFAGAASYETFAQVFDNLPIP